MDENLNCQIQSKRQDIKETVHPCLGDVSYRQQLDNCLAGYCIKTSAQRAERGKKRGKKEKWNNISNGTALKKLNGVI